ncbi:hypothetical protein [Mycoplasmopsis bovis]|uniref:hypothetical protein n=1 Tax=Mycoplasmopsis bovis TaxID=28903 RepID=UPI001F39DAF0|nr:hypothetical protein [Mycoplasmopsis bovis]
MLSKLSKTIEKNLFSQFKWLFTIDLILALSTSSSLLAINDLTCNGLIVVPEPLPKSIIWPPKVLAHFMYSACGSITIAILPADTAFVRIF